MYRLPVSSVVVDARRPSGVEEMMLFEAQRCDRLLAVELVRCLTSVREPADLVVHDFEALLLYLHSLVFGDTINADAQCRCRERVDVSFRSGKFLAARAPRKLRGLSAGEEPGWFTLAGNAATFRLPTVADQIAVAAERDPGRALATRCVRPVPASARTERAMAALAPPLSGMVSGNCPYCGEAIELFFDVPLFVLREMQVQSSLICNDVHLLAAHYHWPEDHILMLPPQRRQRYVEMVTAGWGGA